MLRFGVPVRGREEVVAAVVGAVAAGSRVIDVRVPDGAGRSTLASACAGALSGGGVRVEMLVGSDVADGSTVAPLLAGRRDEADDREPAGWWVTSTVLDVLGGGDVVLLIDDAHLMDELSATVVLAGCRRGLTSAVLLRPPAPISRDDVARLISDGAVIETGPLPDDVVETIAVDALGVVEPITVRRLVTAAAGRPKWLRAAVGNGIRTGALRRRRGVWAWDGAVRMADNAAAAGRTVAPAVRDVVAAAIACGSLTVDEATSAWGEEALHEAIVAGFLNVVVDGRRRVVRVADRPAAESVATCSAWERADVGASLLELLQRDRLRRNDDVARLTIAAVEHDATPPIECLAVAARRVRRSMPNVAEDLVRRGLTHPMLDAPTRSELQWLLADLLEKQGRHAEAVRVLSDAPVGVPQAVEQVVQVASNSWWSEPGRITAIADESVDLGVPGADLVAATQCWMLAFSGEADPAAQLARQLCWDERCSPLAQVWATTAAVSALSMAGHGDDASEALAQGMAVVHATDDPYSRAQLEWAAVFASVLDGAVSTALRMAEDGYRNALATDDAGLLGGWAAVMALAASAAGDLDVSVARLLDVTALLDPLHTGGAYGAGALAESHMGMCLAQRGDTEAGRHHVESAAATGALGVPGLAAFTVWFRRDAAWVGLVTPSELLDTVVEWSHLPAIGLPAAVDALRLGAIHAALPVISDLAARSSTSISPLWAELADALVRPAARGADDAIEQLALAGHVGIAAEMWQLVASSRAPVEAARARLRRDTLVRELGRPALTPMMLAPALSTLTSRELDIAVRVSRGASSRTVAAELGVSPRTVDNHLGRIYTKLDVPDRLALAALLAPIPITGRSAR